MNKIYAYLLLLFLVMPALSTAKSEEETVRDTTAQVLKQLNENREKLSAEPQFIQQLVRELIVPHFDFALMSQLVMGKHWQTFELAERRCFIAGFRNMLVERYAYILLSYDNQNIEYHQAKDIGKEGLRLVQQTISRDGAKPLTIGYAMENMDGEWKVADLVIDDVSLVRSHRGMFQSRLHSQGRDYFIRNFPECSS